MQHPKHQNKKRAVTLTELLVVVVIISLLATIAVPVYINKVEQARIATAIQETRELANAEEQCAIAHQVYVPLQVLDDNREITDRSKSPDDMISERQLNRISLIYATRDISNQVGKQETLVSNTIAVRNLVDNWQGPFVNFQRFAFGIEIRQSGNTSDPRMSYDFPLDPWGNPYRLYSPLGPVGTGALNDFLSGNSGYETFSNGVLMDTDRGRFDRFAVVSFGPNRQPDLYTLDPRYRDDIYTLFGGVFTESSFQAFYR